MDQQSNMPSGLPDLDQSSIQDLMVSSGLAEAEAKMLSSAETIEKAKQAAETIATATKALKTVSSAVRSAQRVAASFSRGRR